jgi:hypothetical protein
MCNRTTVAKAVVTTVSTLAIALLIIGMGVNSTWAGSDQPSGLNFTPISPEVITSATAITAPFAINQRTRVAPLKTAACLSNGKECNKPEDCCSNECGAITRGSTVKTCY